MNDLISRSALIESLVSTGSEVVKNAPFDVEWLARMYDRYNEIVDLIKRAPAVEAAPVRRGHWSFDNAGFNYQCSECRKWRHGATNFCPHCGADMSQSFMVS